MAKSSLSYLSTMIFYRLNNRGKIHIIAYKLNLDSYAQLKRMNYPKANLDHQVGKQWMIDYLEHCFTL